MTVVAIIYYRGDSYGVFFINLNRWLGYAIDIYNITDDGLRAYADSIHVSAKKVSGLSSNIGDVKCNAAAPYCQKISAKTMAEYFASMRHTQVQHDFELSSEEVV
jgi:hypothetical protein